MASSPQAVARAPDSEHLGRTRASVIMLVTPPSQPSKLAEDADFIGPGWLAGFPNFWLQLACLTEEFP